MLIYRATVKFIAGVITVAGYRSPSFKKNHARLADMKKGTAANKKTKNTNANVPDDIYPVY